MWTMKIRKKDRKYSLEEKEKLIDKWNWENGACDIDLNTKEVIFFEKVLFFTDDDKNTIICMEDLDDTINYLRRLRDFLHKLRYKTNTDGRRNIKT